jgi:sigma-B regulation protein RsbU (phosphoserine phosphatase)
MATAKILIVDDEALNTDYLEQELEGADYETSTAANGQEALERVRSDPPDLILLDIMMPVMDGFEALRRLQADPETRHIPVIVISAASEVHSVVKGLELGAEDFLPKPFEPKILHARIGSSLEKKRLHDLEQVYLKGLQRELDIAREIQEGFLPSELPRVDGWELAAYFKSAREVAGDFYDAFVLPGGELVCLVGDVCDKGVGAALFMTLFRSLIRAAFTEDVFQPSSRMSWLSHAEHLRHVISSTGRYVEHTHEQANMFATVFAAVVDPRNGNAAYVNCGNEPGLLASGTQPLVELPPTGPVLGVIPGAQFEVRELTLREGDVLMAFTDGIPDARNRQGESFGTDRVRALLKDGPQPPTALLERLHASLSDFIGSTEPFDDITVVALGRNGEVQSSGSR